VTGNNSPKPITPQFHLFIQLFHPFYKLLPFLCLYAFCALLGQSGLDGLEDFNLDTSLGLVDLGSVGTDDSLRVGKTSSDGLDYGDVMLLVVEG
jgi:hypothetical protein